ncbi:MAG: 3'-phosphoesterase [Candidatus Altiarchaeales archaeon]|nr:3'-phosphoesterase [Candidatus Altiarchaeales archaeon]MBD3416142.1 3'-phosphoesterase [Candidatus Altiarchaeales archaeon]
MEEYRSKRDPGKTTEPFDDEVDLPRPVYAIQEHHASHLHWDLRLEFNGVLKSWALPKEPPSDAGVKRLAVETEDHPLAYATFEGTIPKGEYGGGEVRIWDMGTFEALEEGRGKYVLDLRGEKLKGGYVLLQTRMGGNPRNWLFFKKKG